MLRLALILLVIAVLAAAFGFSGAAGSFMGMAKIVFFVALVLAVLSFFGGGFRQGFFQRGFFRRRYFWQ
jgi:uncharacterized membrane protein YtjA (UPF0391 family)